MVQSLTGKGQDQIQFARVSMEDLDIELRKIQQARGIRLGDASVSPQLVARFQDELTAEEDFRLLPKLLRVLLSVFAEGLDPQLVEPLGKAMVSLLDYFLLKEDFDDIQRMLGALEKLRQRAPSGTEVRGWQSVFNQVREKISDSERIHRVAEIIETTPSTDKIQKSFNFLKYLDRQSFAPLLDVLETVNRPEARKVLSVTLARIGAEQVDKLIPKLSNSKITFVRDIMSILEMIDPPNKLDLLSRLLDHSSLAIRVEALKVIGRSAKEQGLKHVNKALDDADGQMRVAAAQILASVSPPQAQRRLLNIVQDGEFATRANPEQVGFFAALAMTNGPDAMQFLKKELQAKSLLNKKRLEEHKRNIISGLANAATIGACQLLSAELKGGLKEPGLKAAAERAVEAIKKKMINQ
jgi:hypothetical protein